MNRREVLLALPGIAAWPPAAVAQQRARAYTILWVSTEAEPDPFIAGFREGMRERGYNEGQNLSFALRYAPATRRPTLPLFARCSRASSRPLPI